MSEYQLQQGQTWYNKSKGIIRKVVEPYTDEWFAERLNGIGGSESGTVLGMNNYEGGSCLELFYTKIGLKPQRKDGNKYTFFGSLLEQSVADVWEYHDGTENGYIKNYEDKNKMRECRNVNGFITNIHFPHLYVNIDRLIQKGAFSLLNGHIMEDNGILECKTMSSYVAKKWESGLPPMYIMQVVQQCMCMGLDYAEIAVLELDNRNLSVYPIEPTAEHKEMLLTYTHNFWYNMVLPAKELVQEMNLYTKRGEFAKAEQAKAAIEQLEPAADGSESYKQFMNERWLSEANVIKADEEMIENIKQLTIIKELAKKIEPDQTFCENKIREYMRECDEMDCGLNGKVTWKTGSNGKTRTLRTASFKFDHAEIVEDLYNSIKSKI